MDYEMTIKHFIIDTFLFGDGSLLQSDTSFLETGIIDSTGMLSLILFLEETFDISVDEDELIPENLDSLQNLVHYLGRKKSQIPAS
jgi:acyl carrier protein